MSDNKPKDINKEESLFNDDEFTAVGSLSDYISRHLQKRAIPKLDTKENSNPKALFHPNSSTYQPDSDSEKRGIVLHHLDSQLNGNHLENLLPTAATRYQIIRNRLVKELETINEELKQYRSFNGSEYKSKIEALEVRATLLKRKIFELDMKIPKLNPFQFMYSKIQSLSSKPPDNPKPKSSSPWTIILNPNRKLRDEVSAIGRELESLQHILAEQLHNPSFTPQQLGRLINEYDTNLKKAERMMEQLSQRRNLASRLNDKLSSWYSKLYNSEK